MLTGARSSRHLLFAHPFSRHAYRHENIIPIPIYKKSWCPFSELESISNVKRICSEAGLVCMSDSRCVLKESSCDIGTSLSPIFNSFSHIRSGLLSPALSSVIPKLAEH